MPAVDLGHAEEPVERAEPHVHVRVLEEGVRSLEDEDEGEHALVGSQGDEGAHGEDGRRERVQRVRARRVQEVEPGRAVVLGVDPPEEPALVLDPVEPVDAELRDDERERELESHGPRGGPDAGDVDVEEGELRERRPELEREARRDEEGRVRPEIAVGAVPLGAVREQALEGHDEDEGERLEAESDGGRGDSAVERGHGERHGAAHDQGIDREPREHVSRL